MLHRAIEVRSLTRRVQRDGMTGLFNHDYMQQQPDREIVRHRRYGSSFSLLMIDIDPFKEVNDAHGHRAGGKRFSVTISIGVVSCPAGVSCPDRQQLLQLADDAMYTSKKEGRDRVTQTVPGPADIRPQ